MEPFNSYIPQDRRLALAQGETLPERAQGSALFADISGFTPLTERLTTLYGPGRGAEELSGHLNTVYDALISQVEYFGGSVISFAGDAIMCWFDESQGDAAGRSVVAALAMHMAMSAFTSLDLGDGYTVSLAMKTAVTTGQARRFLVGDPEIQLIDTLAGQMIDRLSLAEKLANPAELLIDKATFERLSDCAILSVWRTDKVSDISFAVLTDYQAEVSPVAWPTLPQGLTLDQIRPWLLTAVYERELKGQGQFLPEIRPAAALFLKFTGLNYEDDPEVGQKLDDFLSRAQNVLSQYGGTLLQLTIGDKGSYLYASFGALIAHEDDTYRAANAALELEKLPLLSNTPVQIGISRGMMRAGSYGSHGRRTYGVLGDDVNLAARLMERADPGQILVSENAQRMLRRGFYLDLISEIQFRGKQNIVAVYELHRRRRPQTGLLETPKYNIPLIGRDAEKEMVLQKIEEARSGKGQIVGFTADAGMGKSRLLAEIIQLASEEELPVFVGECQSFGANIPYLVWLATWHQFFAIDHTLPLQSLTEELTAKLSTLAPDRISALPLLAEMLGIAIPDNALTASLEPQSRRTALETLLLECLKSRALEAGEENRLLIFVLEDLHWIDPASHDLLESVGRLIVQLPVLILLAYRPPDRLRLQKPRIEVLPHFTHIELNELSHMEAEQLIQAKIQQLFVNRATAVPDSLIRQITNRAQGNPFYVEELINYLHDRGTDLKNDSALLNLELPTSLHSLILSRIDQLNEEQKLTLKIASIIGRMFRFNWLMGYYPELGDIDHVKAQLAELARLDLTPVDQPEPELVYMFKHIVTQEVTYASLPFSTRAILHEQLADYLESLDAERFVDLLAYHYERSENDAKKRQYLEKAGKSAADRFANEEALDYINRALALTPDEDAGSLYQLIQQREQLFNLLGHRQKQEQDLLTLKRLARNLRDEKKEADIALRHARYAEMLGNYDLAAESAQQALAMAQLGRQPALQAAAYLQWGRTLFRLADYEKADRCFKHAHKLSENVAEPDLEADCLLNIGNVSWSRGEYTDALAYYKQALTLKGQANNRRGESIILNNMGVVALSLSDYGTAKTYYEQALDIMLTIGDRRNESFVLGNLGLVAAHMGEFEYASSYQNKALNLRQEMNDKYGENLSLMNLGTLAFFMGQYDKAVTLLTEVVDWFSESGNSQGEAESLVYLALLYNKMFASDQQKAKECCEKALTITKEIGARSEEAIAWRVFGHVYVQEGQWEFAQSAYETSFHICHEIGNENAAQEAIAGLLTCAIHQKNLDTVRELAEGIYNHLEVGHLYGTDDPLSIYAVCFAAFDLLQDPRATKLKRDAFNFLQQRAQTIIDEAEQKIFLEMTIHQTVQEAFLGVA